ncbi:MAG: proton-conducting transporter membrane subunit [Propionibacteriaceae bacterium]|nr:proton-conducting transporter membrane subunit [Propionibacteriaceae bacterium]
MIASLLPLLVALPLASAGLSVVARFAWVERALLLAVPAITMTGGCLLLAHHAGTPVIAHNVGAYIGGVAIVFASDTLTALMLVVTGLVTLVSCVYLMSTGEDRYRFVPALILMLITGVNGAILTGDLFNLFVFVEVMLLPSYALVAVTGSWRRLGVGRMFVIVNLVTSTILVIGVGFVYGAAGTVNLAALAGVARDNPSAALAVVIVLFALLVKGGVVPVHGWLPRSYPATSAGIMALFSGIHTKVGLYAAYRIYATVYGPAASWLPVLAAVVIATIAVGGGGPRGAPPRRGARAAQRGGQILVGIVVFTQLSLAAGLFYMVHHMVTMGSLVMASGAIEATYGTGRFDRLQGLMKREPLIATVMALGFASLVGLPPTSGLWGKVGLLGGAAEASQPLSVWLLAVIGLASVVSLMALQRVWVHVFWGPPMKHFLPDDPVTSRGERTEIDEAVRVRARHSWPAVVLIGVSVALFVAAGAVWPYFERAAAGLIDVSGYVKAVLGG